VGSPLGALAPEAGRLGSGRGDVVSVLEEEGGFVVVKMTAVSRSRRLYADVDIPDRVNWRPSHFEPEGLASR
jgi:hypothetical protein